MVTDRTADGGTESEVSIPRRTVLVSTGGVAALLAGCGETPDDDPETEDTEPGIGNKTGEDTSPTE